MKKLLDVGLTNIDMNGIKVRIYDREKMKEIVFVTTNKGKIAYANELLSNITVIPYEYDLVEPRECLAYYDGNKLELFESIGPGILSTEIKGVEKEHKLSDLWNIVEPNGFGKTLAEFSEDDFNKHRKHREKSSLSMFSQWYEKLV